MYLLNVKYQVKPDLRDEFFENILTQGLDEMSRKEVGNLCYDYYYSADNDDILFLVEHWQDEEAFTFHTQTPHFKMLQELKEEYVIKTDMVKTSI